MVLTEVSPVTLLPEGFCNGRSTSSGTGLLQTAHSEVSRHTAASLALHSYVMNFCISNIGWNIGRATTLRSASSSLNFLLSLTRKHRRYNSKSSFFTDNKPPIVLTQP
jgi:hypothetical protein